MRKYGISTLGMIFVLFWTSGYGKAADLSKVEKLYNQGKYQEAIVNLNKLTESKSNVFNLDVLRWSAKLSLAIKDYTNLYYYSGWLNAADNSPNKIWDSAEFLFSLNPDYTTILWKTLPAIKDRMPKRQYATIYITATYVRALRRYVEVDQNHPTRADIKFFENLVDSINSLDMQIGKDQYDMAASLASGRFYHFMAIVNDLRLKVSRSDIEKLTGMKMGKNPPVMDSLKRASRKIKMSYYKMAWVDLQAAMPYAGHYPDILYVAGDALVNMGDYNKDPAMIKRGLVYLEAANRQKPSEAIKASIALGKMTLKRR